MHNNSNTNKAVQNNIIVMDEPDKIKQVRCHTRKERIQKLQHQK